MKSKLNLTASKISASDLKSCKSQGYQTNLASSHNVTCWCGILFEYYNVYERADFFSTITYSLSRSMAWFYKQPAIYKLWIHHFRLIFKYLHPKCWGAKRRPVHTILLVRCMIIEKMYSPKEICKMWQITFFKLFTTQFQYEFWGSVGKQKDYQSIRDHQ